ncbi:MAG: L,D-transpeptidase [Flavobacterium sp.]|nr:MAG: L,D-transpeptidase [Flavobacterium sp.]
MKSTKLWAAIIVLSVLMSSCKKEPKATAVSTDDINTFLTSHPNFKPYSKDLTALYQEHNEHFIWYDGDDRNTLSDVLYDKASQIQTEGVLVPLPYQEEYDKLFSKDKGAKPENDLLLSAMYCFYAKKVIAGIDSKQSKRLGWYLPRERVSYVDYLEELMKDPDLVKKDDDENISLYYNLRKGLQRYRQMKKSGMTVDAQGVSIDQRIKTIVVNMERCRWLSPDAIDVPEYIAVNIPSYKMRYVRDGKTALESNVVVGDEANRTVVFSGKMSYLVFSPYWNIPESIVEKEINPAIEKDPDYLEKHNMEWQGKHLRQRPGGDNSLGLIKFMFPNSNNIYLHDTPAKSLFKKEDRALSHGCVRVQKARDLAVMILDDDPNWSPEKVDEAMHSGEETQYPLKRKIPVYIAYFTATADENGNVEFFDDVYQRDNKLASLLYKL